MTLEEIWTEITDCMPDEGSEPPTADARRAARKLSYRIIAEAPGSICDVAADEMGGVALYLDNMALWVSVRNDGAVVAVAGSEHAERIRDAEDVFKIRQRMVASAGFEPA